MRQLHRSPEYAGALFQVASQFNLLEMVGPEVTPEDGVTRYDTDRTQGPACAIAAGAATIYRLAVGRLWAMRNGYAMCTSEGLAVITGWLEGVSAEEIDGVRAKLRIGVHREVEGRCGRRF